MKNFTILLFSIAFLTSTIANAQEQETKQHIRCGTMKAIETAKKNNPEFAAMLEQREKEAQKVYQDFLAKGGKPGSGALARTSTLTGPVTIPVVVHVVHPTPNLVTEEQIDYLLNRLNLDYSGLNPDSTNATGFYNIRGHSLLRFTRARRDPSGNLTTGLEKRVGNVLIGTNTYQPIKHSSDGGLDPWDITKYYNIWVGAASGGLLGIAPGIGPGNATETTASSTGIDGVCISIDGFSNGCFSAPAFAMARTAVHEIGHNFGLFHIFSGCAAGADFGQLTTGQTLPANLLAAADDTPSQSSSTSGCPSGSVASNCAGVPNPPGKNYQNQMDYSDDPCLTMFTKGQVARMEYVLENFRSGYLTTNGATPPSSVAALDVAAIDVVSPGGTELQTSPSCTVISYPVPACPGSFIPKLMIRNDGSTTLTSVTATVTVNGTPSAPQTFTVNLLTDRTAVLTFAAQSLISGSNTIVFNVSAPNGGVDAVATNNSITKTINIASALTAPITEGFESTTFPPANWTLTQISGTGNWARNTAAFKSGTASAKFDNYNYSNGTSSSLTSPPVNFASGISTATLTFQYAHRTYSGENDKLEVFVSTNCGSTWTSVWMRSGATGANALVTVTGTQTSAFTPTAAQWTQSPISVDLTAYKNQTIQVRFVATSGYGNNLYLDDINIFGTTAINNDAGVTTIINPTGLICGTGFTPSFTVKNFGTSPLTSVVVNYRLDGTTTNYSQTFTGLNIASNASSTLTFSAPQTGLSNGTHSVKAFTTLPNGVADLQVLNDTAYGTFNFFSQIALPVVEGFESTTFPPAGWQISNPDNGITWARSTLSAKSGVASARVNFYSYATTGQLDYLVAPLVNFAGNDSAFVSFDYAYKQYDAPSSDTLEIVISNNCGSTWQSIWKKGGSELTTSSGYATGSFTPTAAQWTSVPVKVNLGAYINSGAVFIAFRSKNNYGNNLYLDNINIYGKIIPNYDVRVSEIINPGNTICEVPTTPKVRVFNDGKITTTSVTVSYTLNGGTPVTKTFTGLNIPLAKDTVLNLADIVTLTPGTNYIFKAYTSLPNGQVDQNPSNDTTTKSILLLNSKTIPLTESFESTTFPPTSWEIVNANSDITWQRYTNPKITASNLLSAAGIRNYRYTPTGREDYLVSPVTKFTANDTAILKFDVAAATYQYPGSTVIPMDTLELQLTLDCGKTWTSIYKKWGDQLQTVNDPNASYVDTFFTKNTNQWRTDSVVLGTSLANGGYARFRFKNTCFGGNNIYIDNINLYSKTLSQNVKQNGYTVSPNPARNSITIQHYMQPSKLRGVGFYNGAGQRVLYRSYNGNADSYLVFDISSLAAGIYTVKLEYTNKTIAEKIIKL